MKLCSTNHPTPPRHLPLITASHAELNKGRQMLPEPSLMKSPGWISPLLSPIEGRQNEAGPLIFSCITWSSTLAPAPAARW